MPLPFDATLKDLAQVSPRGLLAAFDTAPALPVSLLNIDLSTVTTNADLVFGLGQPLQEIVHPGSCFKECERCAIRIPIWPSSMKDVSRR